MSIYETFSKRKKRLERAGEQDIYQYDKLPHEFRVQIIHIWNGAIGHYYSPYDAFGGPASPANVFWEVIHNTLARELGLFTLGEPVANPNVQCQQYLLKADASGALDVIELSFRVIERMVKKKDRVTFKGPVSPKSPMAQSRS